MFLFFFCINNSEISTYFVTGKLLPWQLITPILKKITSAHVAIPPQLPNNLFLFSKYFNLLTTFMNNFLNYSL